MCSYENENSYYCCVNNPVGYCVYPGFTNSVGYQSLIVGLQGVNIANIYYKQQYSNNYVYFRVIAQGRLADYISIQNSGSMKPVICDGSSCCLGNPCNVNDRYMSFDEKYFYFKWGTSSVTVSYNRYNSTFYEVGWDLQPMSSRMWGTYSSNISK
jgi:hypothetical protein